MDLMELASAVVEGLKKRGLMLATAESCTGGWVAQTLTSVPGSSAVFERGFVTYTNTAKHEMLGVSEKTLAQHGAVSEQTVREMAAGALAHSHAQVALSISGVAGPGGGSLEKPVGTVCFGWAWQGEAPLSRTEHLPGNREAVRQQAVTIALQGVLDILDDG